MPYKDPRKKRGANQKWRRKAINEGYGKWLYERRKLRFNDAERFRVALEQIVEQKELRSHDMRAIAQRALAESRIAEELLGEFKRDTHRKPRREAVDDAVERVAARRKK